METLFPNILTRLQYLVRFLIFVVAFMFVSPSRRVFGITGPARLRSVFGDRVN